MPSAITCCIKSRQECRASGQWLWRKRVRAECSFYFKSRCIPRHKRKSLLFSRIFASPFGEHSYSANLFSKPHDFRVSKNKLLPKEMVTCQSEYRCVAGVHCFGSFIFILIAAGWRAHKSMPNRFSAWARSPADLSTVRWAYLANRCDIRIHATRRLYVS